MFTHLRLFSKPPRRCPHVHLHHLATRSFSRSVSRFTDLAPEPKDLTEEELLEQDPLLELIEAAEAAEGGSDGATDARNRPETYNGFLAAIGNDFKKAEPRKWLGGEVPFPMNPSFKPPPPISDTVRTQMYELYMKDPRTNNIRALSQKFHISLKRVDAILRLKGLEKAWVKGKQLQTGFLVGMEKLLDAKQPPSHLLNENEQPRYDVHEADTLEEEENRDAARQRYQRLYWESVSDDGREPIVPGSLQHAKETARRHSKFAQAHKSGPELMPRIRDTAKIKTPSSPVQVLTKAGRPTLQFVDVGGKFLDVAERQKRMAAGARRRRHKYH